MGLWGRVKSEVRKDMEVESRVGDGEEGSRARSLEGDSSDCT